jgi:Concanavalin A-like lectin/glucanases superfamily
LYFDHWYDDSNFDYVQSSHLATSTWYHFAAVQDATRIYLYINGTLSGSSEEVSNTNYFGGSPPTIGVAHCNTTLFYYPGKIDDLRFYNHALSVTEIKQLYNAGR